MKKKILVFLIILILSQFGNSNVYAATGCQPIYGGGETCTTTAIAIEKTIFNPQSSNTNDPNAYVHNLGINDAKYKPGANVIFHVKVINTSNQLLSKIQIKDTFPEHLSFASDFSQKPGSYNSNNKTWSATINSLQPNEQVTYVLIGRADANQQTTCLTNHATATTSDGKAVHDAAQFCIEGNTSINSTTKGGLPLNQTSPTTKGGLPVLPPTSARTMPPTGPETLPFLSLIPTAIAGFYLRKLAKK